MKKKQCKGLLINAIICYVIAGFYAFAIIAFATNLMGTMDIYNSMVSTMYPNYSISIDTSMLYFEIGFNILIAISFGNFYLTGYKHRFYSREYASRIMLMSVLCLLCGIYIPSIVGIFISISMKKNCTSHDQEPVKEEIKPNKVSSDIPQGKLVAMTEAVERLKQLRDSGVISEEEYYINLNKILEG